MNEVIIHGRKVVDHDDEVVIRNISTHSMRNLIVITAVLFIFHGMGFIATWFIFRCLYFCFNSTSWRFHAKTETWSLFVSPFHQNFRIWTYNLGLINMKLFPPLLSPKKFDMCIVQLTVGLSIIEKSKEWKVDLTGHGCRSAALLDGQ
jgi:hypothetical protein